MNLSASSESTTSWRAGAAQSPMSSLENSSRMRSALTMSRRSFMRETASSSSVLG